MPTIIQNLAPLQRSVPPTPKPAEPRSEERKEDFQQLLDGAANKPAQRPEETAKPAKPATAEAKKPGEKASTKGAAGKGKASGKDNGGSVAATGEAASDEATEAQDDAATQATDAEHAAEQGEPVAHEKMAAKADGGEEESDDPATAATPPDAVALALAAQAAASKAAPTQGASKASDDTDAKGAADAVAQDAIQSATTAAQRSAAAKVKAVDGKAMDKPGDADADPQAAEQGDAVDADGVPIPGAKEAAKDGSEATDADADAQTPAASSGVKKSPDAPGVKVQPLGADRPPDAGVKGSKVTADAAAKGQQTADAVGASVAAMSNVAEFAAPDAADEKSSAKSVDGADAVPTAGLDAALASAAPGGHAAGVQKTDAPAAPQLPPEAQFADANHDSIVTGVKAQLLPHGGSMQIRLDPPELGALKVMVEMRDGAMTATFQTSNEDATRLLSHSLNQLKQVLEGQGVSVERLQVQQAPRNDSQSSGGDGKQQQQSQQQGNWQDEHAARQEQQRKEVLRRMWRKVAGMTDPIDVTA
jgi:flagellar hook-length control protein FliK